MIHQNPGWLDSAVGLNEWFVLETLMGKLNGLWIGGTEPDNGSTAMPYIIHCVPVPLHAHDKT